MTSLVSRINDLGTQFNPSGFKLKGHREPFDRRIKKHLSPEIIIVRREWSSSNPSIVFMDNDRSCLSQVIEECEQLPQFSNFTLVGVYVPPGTDPDKTIEVASSFGQLVVLDSGEYVDKNCPECNEANIKAAKLRSLGVQAQVSPSDPREEFCPVGLMKAALDVVNQ